MKVLIALSGGNINSPMGDFLVSDKLHPFISIAQKKGVHVSFIFKNVNYGTSSRVLYEPQLTFELSLSTIKEALSEFVAGREKGFNLVKHWRTFLYVWNKTRWRDLLKRNPVDAVVGIGISSAAVDSARALGVQTVEVQHGIFDHQGAKKYWNDSAPDTLLAWSSWSNQAKPFVGDIRVIGHPITWRDTPDVLDAHEYDRLSICVALQYKRWLYFVVPSIDTQLLKCLRTLASDKERLVFRIHPIVDARPIRRSLQSAAIKFLFPDSKVERPRKVSLANSIKGCRALVTLGSSSAYEFGLLGKPSLIVNPSSRDKYIRIFSESGIDTSLICDTPEGLRTNPKQGAKKMEGTYEQECLNFLSSLGTID